VVIYVDDLKVIGMANAIFEIIFQLKGEFEMKDIDEIFCLGVQVEHLTENIFLHQSLYT
jgi:hypothetical protein